MLPATPYESWGGLRIAPGAVSCPADAATLATPAGPWMAYGNGRSYGDSCLTSIGTLIDMRGLDRIHSFDATTGLLRAEAGVMLGTIIRHVAGSGWFPAVVPGTQHVTLAGAIANDIHGKNHHRRGTFGRHVMALTLLRSDGSRRTCSPTDNTELFRATIGGMGLTGVILDAEVQLMAVTAQDIVQEAIPLEGLSDFFSLAPDCETRHEYVVAWLDSLAQGKALGRGVLFCGNHAQGGPPSHLSARPRLSVPFTPPISLVNQPSLRLFNAAYRRKAIARKGAQPVAAGSFFFPLDGVGRWNRLYGPNGLRQHQCVIPMESAEATVRAMLTTAQAADHGSLLTVIKLFGDAASPGRLSFPRPGVTLTLDFAYHGARTDMLLDELDQMVLEVGGRVNPYKDARMSRATFKASFPDKDDLHAWLDPQARSDFAARVGLLDRQACDERA